MVDKEILTVIIQLVVIIGVWIRIETRIAHLEGKFSMFCKLLADTLASIEKGH